MRYSILAMLLLASCAGSPPTTKTMQNIGGQNVIVEQPYETPFQKAFAEAIPNVFD